MVLEMELRAMSDWASDSSTTELVCMLTTDLAFLESASRGSSWHRCPILRLIHLVQGLSCPQRQRMALKARRIKPSSVTTSTTPIRAQRDAANGGGG